MSIVTCSQLGKTFDGENWILDNVDLQIEGEEFIIITGPPGSGKSTLLSILGGYLTETKGEVLILGQKLPMLSPTERAKFRRENLGVVFQNGRLIPSLTVLENVITPLLCSKENRKSANLMAANILSYMGMDKKKDCYLDELSGAERELVALSRALVNQPKLLLLDEPTQFLDHQTGVKVMTYLRQMAMDHQMTIISVLSDVRLFPFASRIIRMKSGKINDILGESFLDSPFLRI